MAGKAATLDGGIRIADYLSTGLLARTCPPEAVDAALTTCGRQSKRRRDLPAHAVVYYVMALSLYRHVNYVEALRVVTEGMQFLGDAAVRREVGKSGISAARQASESTAHILCGMGCGNANPYKSASKPAQCNILRVVSGIIVSH